MYLSHIKIENFRQFEKLNLDLSPGLNLIIGENDSGKSTLIDAIRLILGTRDNERIWLDEKDFRCCKVDGEIIRSNEIKIEAIFKGFDSNKAAPFLEWISIDKNNEYFLKLKLVAKKLDSESTKYGRKIIIDIAAGSDDKGSQMDGLARELLKATYLKPLRDAEQELKAKRSSRLSQILSSHPEINLKTEQGKKEKSRIERAIKLLNKYITKNDSVYKKREQELNKDYFKEFLFEGDSSDATISMSSSNFKDILEKLELSIDENRPPGLGINNLLFMATELLLLKPEKNEYDLPLLLIEEPEAHIHPQYQLNLVNYFQKKEDVQVLMTSHSPNLASKVDLEKLIIMKDGKAFPMGSNYTKLEKSDYSFLKRFLDVTKSNMFFAKGIIFVEGAAEELLLPFIAEKIGKPLHRYGVSIVNVQSINLFRYSNIFIRKKEKEDFGIKIACVSDFDIPSDEASNYLNVKKKKEGETEAKYTVPPLSHWLSEDLQSYEESKKASYKFDSNNKELFLSKPWTLEYALAKTDFALELHKGISISKLHKENRKKWSKGQPEKNLFYAIKKAKNEYHKWISEFQNESNKDDLIASKIYKNLYKEYASKPESIQYFMELVEKRIQKDNLQQEALSESDRYFPKYLLDAINHVTAVGKPEKKEGVECQTQQAPLV